MSDKDRESFGLAAWAAVAGIVLLVSLIAMALQQ